MNIKEIHFPRIQALREELIERDMEAAFITKRENYIYLSGFTGSLAYLVISQEETALFTDFRYEEQAKMQAPAFQVIKFQGSFQDALNEYVKEKKLQKIGFEEDHLTFKEYSKYESSLEIEMFSPLGGLVEKMRNVKDASEIQLIKEAVAIADKGFSHILKFIRPGIKEIELASELEYFMKKEGAKGPSFETIVASGERSSMPHGTASQKKLALGDPITFDYGAVFQDYCSDMTRTVFLGDPGEEMRRVYSLVLEAQKKALEGAKEGLLGKEVDSIARDMIYSKGFNKNFGHGLGHGVGLEIHEEPRLSPSGNTRLVNGMVVTVEPGIYIPGLGGIRIEDMIIISGENPEILTTSTKDLIII